METVNDAHTLHSCTAYIGHQSLIDDEAPATLDASPTTKGKPFAIYYPNSPLYTHYPWSHTSRTNHDNALALHRCAPLYTTVIRISHDHQFRGVLRRFDGITCASGNETTHRLPLPSELEMVERPAIYEIKQSTE